MRSVEPSLRDSRSCTVPVDIKRAMIDWWGPILEEYYGATEGNGLTRISSSEWLMHPGRSAARRSACCTFATKLAMSWLPASRGWCISSATPCHLPTTRILSRTAAAQHLIHPNWSTLGDVGYVDTDGYLYLTDRKAFMIISGGVNIYPREVEDVLIVARYGTWRCSAYRTPRWENR